MTAGPILSDDRFMVDISQLTTGATRSRRQFLREAGVTAAATAELLAFPQAAAARRARHRSSRPTVAVLGGGVGGLTAAHELAERGFDVTVYERRAWGGKARSMNVPGTGRGGRLPLPAEHGWREVFAGYQNLPDTMRRIPFGSNPNGVLDNLVDAPFVLAARRGHLQPFPLPWGGTVPVPPPYTPALAIDTIIAALQWIPPEDLEHFLRRLVVFLSSGRLRRLGQWELSSWADFVQSDKLSSGSRELFVDFATRFAAASNGAATSTRTIGKATESVLYLPLTGRGNTRVLNAPTNEAWIDPWLVLLRNLGVKLHLNQTVTHLKLHNGRVASAHVHGPNGNCAVHADWFVCALPVERARKLWSRRILTADPQLARMSNIPTGWMTGIQFYLRRRTPIADGPVAYLDSPWAVSSISQAQFWTKRDLSRQYGDGTVHEKLSTIICDWETPGVIYGKPARDCTPRQVAREAWAQIRQHFQYSGAPKLTDDMLVSWFLDPGIVVRNHSIVENEDALFLPTVNTWGDRPPAATAIPNLVLASDYAQVDFDITSMEGANEAARRAVDAILDRSRSAAQPCRVFERQMPSEWVALRQLDDERYKRGEANLFDTDLAAPRPPDFFNQSLPGHLVGDVQQLLARLVPRKS